MLILPAVIQGRVGAGQRPLGPLGAHRLLDAGPVCREVGQLVEHVPLPETVLDILKLETVHYRISSAWKVYTTGNLVCSPPKF